MDDGQSLTSASTINGILAMDSFKQHFNSGFHEPDGSLNMSPREVSLIVAMLSAGTVLGALLAAPAGDQWGRRHALIAAIGVFCIGAILQVCAENVATLTVGRCVPVPCIRDAVGTEDVVLT